MLTPEKMNRLQAVKNGRSMVSTTTFNGNRNRYTSGKIPFTNGSGLLGFIRLSIELAVRATRRNKTGNRANNADCLKAVVEPLSHLSKVQAISFNHKLTETFKMNPYTLKAYIGNQFYTLNLTRSMSDLGGVYA